jgi:hypothetical protein
MLREIAARFTNVLAQRRAAVRKKVSVAVRVRFAPLFGAVGHIKNSEKLALSGATTDVSSCGLGMILPSIRIEQSYLVGEDRPLIVEMDIHDRTIILKVVGRRYEEIGEHLSTRRFLVGAEIVEMTPTDRVAYEYFVANCRKLIRKMPDVVELGRLD